VFLSSTTSYSLDLFSCHEYKLFFRFTFPALPPNLTTPLNCICNRKRGGESSLRIRAAVVSAEIWAEVPELARGFVLSEQ